MRREPLEGNQEVVLPDEHDGIPAQTHTTRGSDQALDFHQVRCEPRVSGDLGHSLGAVECDQRPAEALTNLPCLLPSSGSRLGQRSRMSPEALAAMSPGTTNDPRDRIAAPSAD